MCEADMSSMVDRSPVAKKKKTAQKVAAKYKKAPGAPRRFKSAYIFFSIEKHKEIRAELGEKGNKEKTTNVAKMVSEAWKTLPSEEREYWDDKARSDKERYEVEKSVYDGPWKVLTHKFSKDPNAPKRPMSAFLAYSNSKRSAVKRENTGLANAEVSRVLAAMWKNADKKEKQVYIDEEFTLRMKYKTRIALWRSNEEMEKEVQQKTREDMTRRTMEAHTRHNLEAHTRQLEEEHSGETMYRHRDPSFLPSREVPTHRSSLSEARRGDCWDYSGSTERAAMPGHRREDSMDNHNLSMDHLLNLPMQHSMAYRAYGHNPPISSLLASSAGHTVQPLFDPQQATHLHHQQHQHHQHHHQQQQWGPGIRVSSNSPNSAFRVDALTAQNLGDGGQQNFPRRYPEDYYQDPGRDGDTHDVFRHQSRAYF